jgi:hypothetical protein
MANRFKVWAYADNRAEADKETGARRPCVCLYRSKPSNLWEPESVDMTPRQARLAAALLARAADAAESGVKRFEKTFI